MPLPPPSSSDLARCLVSSPATRTRTRNVYLNQTCHWSLETFSRFRFLLPSPGAWALGKESAANGCVSWQFLGRSEGCHVATVKHQDYSPSSIFGGETGTAIGTSIMKGHDKPRDQTPIADRPVLRFPSYCRRLDRIEDSSSSSFPDCWPFPTLPLPYCSSSFLTAFSRLSFSFSFQLDHSSFLRPDTAIHFLLHSFLLCTYLQPASSSRWTAPPSFSITTYLLLTYSPSLHSALILSPLPDRETSELRLQHAVRVRDTSFVRLEFLCL